MRNLKFVIVLAMAGVLVACEGGASVTAVAPTTGSSATASSVTAKLNYVCAYSGDFSLVADGLSLIPVPGVAAGASAAELAAKDICNNTAQLGTDASDGEALVNKLIADFKSVGKM